LLHHVHRDRNDEPVGQGQAATDQILMALRRWIELAMVHIDAGHGARHNVMAGSQ
jgi:hypothetical protein